MRVLTKANFYALMIFEFRVYKPSQYELHATAALALYIEISKNLISFINCSYSVYSI